MENGDDRGGLTPEQQAERFSTGGVSFEDSLRRVLAAEPDESSEEVAGEEQGRTMTRRLSEEEVQELLDRERARMADPRHRDTLVDPPDEMMRALKRRGGS